jgi:sulfur carrier protein ThiS adenylyltransferase
MTLSAIQRNLTAKLGGEGLKKVREARVGLAGAGGLGSNCAVNLVRAGFRKLTIADFDVIDPSNLDRQFYFFDQVGMKKTEALKANLLRIDPELELRMIDLKLDRANIRDTFSDCSVVVECLDRAESKSMLVSEMLPSEKLIVTVSGLGGIGSSDDIKVHRVKKNLVVIGDLRSDIESKPAIAPRVSVAAAKQADVVLEHVLNLRP